MALADDVIQINDQLLISDPDFDVRDRGQFYIQQYQLTGSAAALLEMHISMFSGDAGGAGFAANYLLTDYAKNPSANFSYSGYDSTLGNEIYALSNQVAIGLGNAILNDVTKNNGSGDLAISDGIAAGQASWNNFANTHNLGALGSYFPGAGVATLFGGTFPDPLSPNYNLVVAAGSGAFIFGKSISDFHKSDGSDLSGYTTKTINIGNDADTTNDITYVVENHGDRNGDGVIDYNDGVVVAVSNARWDFIDDPSLSGDALGSTLWPANWQAIRNWQPLHDFRIQLVDGGSTDPEAYFKSHYLGKSGDFWGSLESQVDTGGNPFDADGNIRNDFYVFSRYETGTSGIDYMYGGQAGDHLSGGAGNDIIDGGAGNDVIDGGAGSDTIFVGASGKYGPGDKIIDGGSDVDTLDLSRVHNGPDGIINSVDVDLQTGHAEITYLSPFSEIPQYTTYTETLNSIENVVGTKYSDHIVGDTHDNLLSGGLGNDTLDGGAGDDTLIGSTGDDTYELHANNNGLTTIDDDTGALQIDDTAFAGIATHDANNDSWHLNGYTLTPSTVIESGHVSNDLLMINDNNNSDKILLKDFQTGDYDITTGIEGTDYRDQIGSDYLSPGLTITVDRAFDDNLVTYQESDPILNLQGGDDYVDLSYFTGNPIVYAGDGNDYIITNNEYYSTTQAHALIYAGAGSDHIAIYMNDAVIYGEDGSDLFVYSFALPAADPLNNDIVNIVLSGGDGSDYFALSSSIPSSYGNVTIADFGVGGMDTLILGDAPGIYPQEKIIAVDDNQGNTIVQVGHAGSTVTLLDVLATDLKPLPKGYPYYNSGDAVLYADFSGQIRGTNGDDHLVGTVGNDTIVGLDGNDTLDGGLGNDSMRGGTGDDGYYVNTAGDKIIEYVNQGHDTVYSTIAYTLGANVEDLTLLGTKGLAGYGNALDNLITGTSAANQLYGDVGNDTLVGGAGNDGLHGDAGSDSMIGGVGNDTYYVDSAGDSVVENANEGTDKVISTISYNLGANVENLTLSGSANIDGTGNTLANTILGNGGNNILIGNEGKDVLTGGAGNDTLIGGAGADTLTGGTGNDIFVFNSLTTSTDKDMIKDFVLGQDHIAIDHLAFTAFAGHALGALTTDDFAVGTAATTISQHLVYNGTTGALYYDADGLGGAAQVQIALVTGHPALTVADFVLI